MLKSIITIITLVVSLVLPNYSYSKDFFDIGVSYPYGPMELTGFTLFGVGNKEMRLNLNNNPSHTGSLLIGKYGDKTVLDPKYVKEGAEYLVRAIFIQYTDRSLEIYRDEVERYGIHIYRKVRWNTEDTWYKTPVIYTGSVEDSVGGVHGILGEVDFLDMKMYTVTNEDGYTFFVGGKFAFDHEKDNILSDSELVNREVVVYGHMHRLYDDTRVFDTNKPIKIFALVSNHADDSTSKTEDTDASYGEDGAHADNSGSVNPDDINVWNGMGTLEMSGFPLFGKAIYIKVRDDKTGGIKKVYLGNTNDTRFGFDEKYLSTDAEYLAYVGHKGSAPSSTDNDEAVHGISLYRKVLWNTENTKYYSDTPNMFPVKAEATGAGAGILAEKQIFGIPWYVLDTDKFNIIIAPKYAFEGKDNFISVNSLLGKEVIVHGYVYEFEECLIFDTTKDIKIFYLVNKFNNNNK